MRTRGWIMRRSTVLLMVGLVLSACGGGGEGSPTTAEVVTAAPATTIPAPATTVAAPTTTTASTTPTTTTTAPATTTTVAAGEAVVVTRDVPYSGPQLLDVWAPESDGPWPVLVMFHGYAGPSPTNARGGYDALAEAIAAGGVVVYNAEWPIQDRFVEEAGIAACAVGFARSTAADHGGSPDRVTILGHSSGAGVATTVAFSAELLEPSEDCAATDTSIVPDALVSVAGYPDYYISGPGAFLKDIDPAAWEIVDPYTNIGRNPDLAVYQVHGDIDDVSPVQSAIDFDQALGDAGYEVHLTVLEGVGHGSVVAPTFDAFRVTVDVAVEAAHG